MYTDYFDAPIRKICVVDNMVLTVLPFDPNNVKTEAIPKGKVIWHVGTLAGNPVYKIDPTVELQGYPNDSGIMDYDAGKEFLSSGKLPEVPVEEKPVEEPVEEKSSNNNVLIAGAVTGLVIGIIIAILL